MWASDGAAQTAVTAVAAAAAAQSRSRRRMVEVRNVRRAEILRLSDRRATPGDPDCENARDELDERWRVAVAAARGSAAGHRGVRVRPPARGPRVRVRAGHDA